MKKAFQDMLYELGEVNPVHTYYSVPTTSKDKEDSSWGTCMKTKDKKDILNIGSALEDFILLYLYLLGT
ncbi:hypothetical protein Tco_0027625, partial [Tanacetum coccineum]